MTFIFRLVQVQMCICQLKANVGLYYLKAMVMFDLAITVYEIFAVEISMALTVTFRMSQGQM